MRATTYHVLLRISALTIAIVLLFDSGLLSPLTKELSQNAQQYLAQSVGVGATVTPTELNTLTAQISQRDRDLDAREALLNEREISVGLNTSSDSDSNLSTYLLSIVLFIVVVLIVLNYALDFARERRLMYGDEKTI